MRPALLCLLFVSCAREVTPATPAASPHDALDALDARKPVPLLPMMANHQKQNMREHLVAVEEIVSALAVDDFAAVETAVKRIGFSEQMGMMCSHMGSGAPGFTEQALVFHHTADRIADAARKKDAKLVLTELSATMKTCTGWPATFKPQGVAGAEWEKATGSAARCPALRVLAPWR